MPELLRWAAAGGGLLAAVAIIWDGRDVSAQEAQRRIATPTPALTAIEGGSPSEEDVLRTLASNRNARDVPGEYAPGRVIVRFRDGSASAQARTATLQSVGARAATNPEYADFDVIDIDPGLDPEAVATSLSARPDVEYAQPDYRVYTRFRPNDPEYGRHDLPAVVRSNPWILGATHQRAERLPRAALRRVRAAAESRHVDGRAARLGPRRSADAAGHHQPAAIEAAIKRFATDRGPSGRDNEYGYGIINPRATLRGLGLIK
jgi:hypothetical protein